MITVEIPSDARHSRRDASANSHPTADAIIKRFSPGTWSPDKLLEEKTPDFRSQGGTSTVLDCLPPAKVELAQPTDGWRGVELLDQVGLNEPVHHQNVVIT